MRKLTAILIIIYCVALPGCSEEWNRTQSVNNFIEMMASRHQYNKTELHRIINDAVLKEDILKKIAKPAESMPWYRYQKIFLTEARINAGVKFWQENARVLKAAEQRYGVPAEIVVAIIGVETSYGQYTGNYRIIDALSTLAFAYPPRGAFFLGELEQFLLLCRAQQINPLLPLGSYAGAMGMPQFMPSSYINFAIDFNEDHHLDIWHNKADVIASVANYFFQHHWQAGHAIAVPVPVIPENKSYKTKITHNLKPDLRLAELESLNLKISVPLNLDEKVKILELEQEQGEELWVTLNNFYVITQYNHSPLYAMAVYQLSQSILNRKGYSHEQTDFSYIDHHTRPVYQ